VSRVYAGNVARSNYHIYDAASKSSKVIKLRQRNLPTFVIMVLGPKLILSACH
jgi:hypothetical protein